MVLVASLYELSRPSSPSGLLHGRSFIPGYVISSCRISRRSCCHPHKDDKYIEISRVHLFYPITFEIMGPINQVGQDFISELGRRIYLSTDDPRETYFLFQGLSVAVQRFNAVSFTYSFGLTQFEAVHLPKHIIEFHFLIQKICFISHSLGTEYQGQLTNNINLISGIAKYIACELCHSSVPLLFIAVLLSIKL